MRPHLGLCLGLLFVCAQAQAEPRSAWGDFQDALLLESLDGEYDQARSIYRRLNRNLPTNHPVRGEALYALARTSVLLGELEPARQALSEGIRTGVCTDHCRDLLEQIELRSYAVQSVPVRWDFNTSDHSVFHPWRHDVSGSLTLETPLGDDDPALLWSTTRGPWEADRLVIPFENPNPGPETLQFQVLSVDAGTWLRVEAQDREGHRYTWGAGTMMIAEKEELTVTVVLPRMVRTDQRDINLDPSTLAQLEIIDSSAADGNRTGSNRLYLDALELF